MMSPDAIFSTGIAAASYQPYAIVSGVASRRWVLGACAAAMPATAIVAQETTSDLRSIRTLYARIRRHAGGRRGGAPVDYLNRSSNAFFALEGLDGDDADFVSRSTVARGSNNVHAL